MKFKELVSINGMSGLFQLMATKSDGAIVKSIDDGSTKFVAARQHTVTALDGIEVFTQEDNMRLIDVFMIIKSNLGTAGEIDLKKSDDKAIRAYFEKVFPTFDKDRVYTSDMKKMLKWFNIANEKDLIKKEEVVADETTETEEQSK
jgi:Domain of unknown function (DUF5606)